MTLPQDQKVVEALSPQTAQKTFTDGVCLRRSIWRFQHLDFRCHTCERRPELAVVVADQETRFLSKRCRFAQLLGCPLVGWVPRYSKMNHTTRPQLNDDEHEHRAEENVMGLEEIAGPYLAGVVA